MACCGIRSLLIPITSTSPALGRLTHRRLRSLPSPSTISVLRVSSRSASLLLCQDGRRNDPASNEEAASARKEAVEEENAGAELDMSTLEKALAKSFGTALWYTVLIVSLAVFAGAYVFFLVKYSEFGAVPILSGPAK